jgi:citronellol/citronellal dehydrogenase
MPSLSGKTLFITGASRGIGKAIALKAAQDGANIVIAAKTAEPHPKLPGTVYETAQAIEKAGGKALACIVDIRDDAHVAEAIKKAVTTFGAIDILINNASAISPTHTLATEMKRYDLMMDINVRGTFLCSKLCLPHLKASSNPHVLNLAPPPKLEPRWFAPHVAYTLSKFGMSLLAMGMSEEFRKDGIAFNCLWPKTIIATAAIQNILGGEEAIKKSRKPEIVADAAYAILTRDSKTCTGNFFIDEDLLREEGVSDFRHYQVDPSLDPNLLIPDIFL